MNNKKYEEVVNTMLEIKQKLSEGLEQNNKELVGIEYYKSFQIKGNRMNLEQNDIYKAKIRDNTVLEKELEPRKEEDQNFTYAIFDKDQNLIATVDERGIIIFEPEFLEQLGEENMELLGIEEDMEFEDLGEQELSLTKEELEEKEIEKRIEKISEKTGSKEIESYSEMKTDQTPVFDKLTSKQEIDPNAKVTQSETLADMIPEIKQKGIVKVGVVYSDKAKGQSGRFSFVGIDKNGQIQSIDSLENVEGTTTGQTVMSINSRDGSLVEEEQVAGMVRINGRSKTNGQEEMLSVRVGQYGILEVDYVRADLSEDKGERYFSAPIETKNQRPTTRAVREAMDKHKNVEIEDEMDRAEGELERDGDTRLRNIDDTASNDLVTPDEVIVLEDGTETTLAKEAEKAKISPEEFTRRYNERGGKTPDEKIEDIHEEIEEEYGAPTMSRDH